MKTITLQKDISQVKKMRWIQFVAGFVLGVVVEYFQ